jgi:tetratricopeptide (TPR) repeat protein
VALLVALSWDGPRTSKTVVAAPALRNDLRLRGLNRLRMLTVTMMRYSVRNGNRVAYDQPMWARFAVPCLTALLTVPLAAQQGSSSSLETLLKDGDALGKRANFAGAAETFMDAVAHAPASESALLTWADFSLERFRALGLWLRSEPRGTAVLLRIQAEGTPPGTTQREAFLQKAAEGDPGQSGIWGELGMAQLHLGLREDAQASLRKAQEHQPNASSSLELEAQFAAAQGNWAEAETRLRILGHRSTGTLRSALTQWPASLVPGPDVPGGVWQCVRDHQPNCPGATESVEGTTASNAETLFAQERWEQLVALPAPTATDGRFSFWRGVALGQIGNCALAIPSLERGLNDGKEAAAYWLIACYGSVVGHAAAELSAQGKEVAVHQIQGDILLSMKGDASGAAAEYTEALRLKPNDAALLDKRAQAYFNQGDLERAKRDAHAALALDPHRQPTLQLLIRIAMNERDYPHALLLLARFAKLQPDDPWARVQFATAYAQTGRPQDAVRNLQPVLLAGYPDEKGALHALLAGQLRKLGREQEAKAATEQAVKLANNFEQQGAANPQ